MTITTLPKALFFDVFGTCVDWRKTVTESLIDAGSKAGDTKMVRSYQYQELEPQMCA